MKDYLSKEERLIIFACMLCSFWLPIYYVYNAVFSFYKHGGVLVFNPLRVFSLLKRYGTLKDFVVMLCIFITFIGYYFIDYCITHSIKLPLINNIIEKWAMEKKTDNN
jgi:hypothetical protein